MSLLKVKEFAAAIGMKEGTVKVHLNRKKLVKNSNGYIDTELEKNRLYIKEQTDGKGLYNIEQAVEKSAEDPGSSKDSKTASKQKSIVFHDKRSPEQKARDKVYDDIELRQKKAALNNAERSAELKQLELEKKAGKLLPIELAQKIMTINIQTVFRTFEGEAENIAGIFSEVLGGTRADLAEIIKRTRESLEVAIRKAEEDSAAEISQAINEYAETRSRGERK